jgi:4-amino-4-deoxy-L-arabinose transferase-like glycosyltransferase
MKQIAFEGKIIRYLSMILAITVAVVVKVWLHLSEVIPFNSDEAVVALMARHINQGARPIFFYGQAYLGSLDAILIAIGFKVFEEHVWDIRLVQLLLYLGTILTTYELSKRALASKQVGLIAMWFLAIPTVNVTLYTTATLGGYGESLLIGNIILLITLRTGEQLVAGEPKLPWIFVIWGFFVGFGTWVFGLTLVYSLPSSIYLFWKLTKAREKIRFGMTSLGFAIIGGIVGLTPYLIGALQMGVSQLFSELGGSAIAGVEGGNWLSQISAHVVNLLLLGSTVIFGLRPPWEVRWLGLPFIPIVLSFWVWVFLTTAKRFHVLEQKRDGIGLLIGVMVTLLLGFILTPFGADPSGRYYLPLAIIFAILAGEQISNLWKRNTPLAVGLMSLVLIYHLWGTIQVANRFPPGITTQFDAVTQIDHRFDNELINFLMENDVTKGYSNYWVSYPIAFLSQEEIIFIPELPYHLDFRHTTRDNRYQPYNDLIDQADRVGYITTNHPPLNEKIRRSFSNLGVLWQEKEIGDYLVFYQLSQIVRPSEIGLGLSSK